MPAAELAAAPAAELAAIAPRRAADSRPSPFATAFAWLLLVVMDVALKTLGFDRFYRMVRAWPRIGNASPEGRMDTARRGCNAVGNAKAWYLKRAWCLQSAAAATCLLRLRGIPAELVIGVRKIPFYAHAWTEVDGTVLNNRIDGMETLYRVITRC